MQDSPAHRYRYKVVLVANMTWNIWNYRKPVIEALQKAGFQVVVVAPVDDALPKLLKDTQVEFIPLEDFRRNSTRIWGTLRMVFEFVRIYRALKPDLILHFGVQANILGNLSAWYVGASSVCVVTGLGYTFLHRNVLHTLIKWLYRLSFGVAKLVVFENEPDRALMVSTGSVAVEKTRVVSGCGIDVEAFQPRRRNRSNRRIVFSYFGRLLYDKGLREFYEAARLVRLTFPNTEFRIYGTLDKSNPAHIRPSELLHWVKNGTIRYRGVVDDVRPYMAETDVVVLPSYREGLSRTLLEAMAMARPLVVTDVPGCRETVDHPVNGLLVPPRDAPSLSEAMMYCCALTDQERATMGWAGRRKVVSAFSSDLVGAQYLHMVSDVLKIAPGGLPKTQHAEEHTSLPFSEYAA
ncbi:MAG: glycosyltransferase family 4 protein [Saprospiraceae bacterium]